MIEKKLPKIAFVVNSLSQGGAERVVANLSNGLAKAGYEITIISLHTNDLEEYVVSDSIQRVRLKLQVESAGLKTAVSNNWNRLVSLRKNLTTIKPDIVISIHTANNVLSILAAIGKNINIIVSERCHPPNAETSKYWLFLRKFCYGSAHCVVVLTNESKQWIAEHTKAKRIEVIPNFVSWPPDDFPGKVDPDAVLEKNRKLLLAVGRIVKQKGYPLLIEAFSKIADKHPDWDLAIVGDGNQDNLRQLAFKFGLSDRVNLIGGVGNIADWYKEADLFVLSSISEGFPNSLAEAMAAGCPVIAFDCKTGPRDLIDHGINGFLVEAENVENLARGINLLVQDPELRKTFSQTATQIRKKYSYDKILGHWTDKLLTTD